MNHHRTISANPVGTDLVRYVIAMCIANGDDISAAEYAKHWPDSPSVLFAFQQKSVSDALDTSSILGTYGIAGEFLALQKQTSAVEALKSSLFNVPFRTKIPLESATPSGDFVAQAGAIPVRAGTLDSVSPLELFRLGNICTITKELVKIGSPAAESVIRGILSRASAYILDSKFFTPTSVAISGVRPAAITASGCVVVNTSGTSAANARTDIAGLIAGLTSLRSPVFVMRPSTLAALQAKDSTLIVYVGGQPLLCGIPVYKSLGCPNALILFDAQSIAFADGGVDINASSQASIESDDEPVQGSTSPFSQAANFTSFFQRGLYGVRIIREVNWQRTIASAVCYCAVAY